MTNSIGMIGGTEYGVGDHFIFHFRTDDIGGQLDENHCIKGVALSKLLNKYGSKNIEIIPHDALLKMCGSNVGNVTQAELNNGCIKLLSELGDMFPPSDEDRPPLFPAMKNTYQSKQKIIQDFIEFVCSEDHSSRLYLEHSLVHYMKEIDCGNT